MARISTEIWPAKLRELKTNLGRFAAQVVRENTRLLCSPFSKKHEGNGDDGAGAVWGGLRRLRLIIVRVWFVLRHATLPAEPPKRCRAYACRRSPKRCGCGRGFWGFSDLEAWN